MLTPSRNISRPTAKDKRATVTFRTAARRKHQPRPADLFGWTGDAPRFDLQKIIKLALGVWRASDDPRGSMLPERWCSSQNLQLHHDICDSVVRFHANLRFGDDRAPGLIFLLRDLFTDEPVGILRYFLDDDGTLIGRRVLGRAFSSAVKFSDDADVTEGLYLASTVETGIAAMNAGLRPIWSIIGANALAEFPLIDGIEALTVIDGDARATEQAAMQWRSAGREISIMETASPSRAVWDAGDGDP